MSSAFDHNGWLVAINYAGFRDGSLNFGIRVDGLWDIIDIIEPARARAAPMPRPAYPHAEYQPFPENWNGETIHP